MILFGTGSERIAVRYHGSMGTGAFKMRYEGAINSMMRRMRPACAVVSVTTSMGRGSALRSQPSSTR